MNWDTVADAVFLRSQGLTAAMALAVAAMAVPLWRRAMRNPTAELPALGTAIVTAVVIGRLVWLLTTARPQLTNPIDVARANTGMDMLSASWTFALSSMWLGRRHRSLLGQYAGWTLLLAPAAYAAGCLLRRDCAGRTAPSPFGVEFEGYSDLRLPIGLYEAVLLVLALALVVRFRAVLLASPLPALALLGLIEWTVEFGRIGELTRATFGVRSLWLASSATAVFLTFLAAQPWPSRRLLQKVVRSGRGQR